MASPAAATGGTPPTISYLVVRTTLGPERTRRVAGGAAAWVRRVQDLARCRCGVDLLPLFVDLDRDRKSVV